MQIKVILLSAVVALLVACNGGDEPRVSEIDYPEPASHGAELYRDFCGGCHAPPSPASHPAAEWPNIVFRMEQHRVSQSLAPMNEAQRKELIAYLQRHAGNEK